MSGVLIPVFFRRREKKIPFHNQPFFVISPIKSVLLFNFSRDHLRSSLGITCGRGSSAVHFGDHLWSRDHLRFGIICGAVQAPHNSCSPGCFTTVQIGQEI